MYGLIGLLAVYSAYSLFLTSGIYLNQTPRIEKVALKWLSIMVVFLIGFFSLRSYAVKWVVEIWNLIYLLTSGILIIASIINWLHEGSIPPVRNIAKALDEFLISPLLYIGIIIISFVFNKMQDNKNNVPKKHDLP